MKSSLIKEKIKNLDSHYIHPSYTLEQKLLKEIKLGNLQDAMITIEKINAVEHPTLARDSLRSLKNSMIGSCTLFTRAAINGGIDPEDAFDLSDVFIKHIESLSSTQELFDFELEMVETFTKMVQQAYTADYPYPVSKIVKYIHDHLTEKLSVQNVAEYIGLSPDYLSKVFHKEVGMTMTDYIQNQKIELSKQFLIFSDMSITEIATLLEFCNPAYFTNVFKKHTELTPNQFRKEKRQLEF